MKVRDLINEIYSEVEDLLPVDEEYSTIPDYFQDAASNYCKKNKIDLDDQISID